MHRLQVLDCTEKLLVLWKIHLAHDAPPMKWARNIKVTVKLQKVAVEHVQPANAGKVYQLSA